MPDGDAVAHQRIFECERTAQGNRDQILLPKRRNVGDLIAKNTVAKDPVFRNIGADVDIVAQSRQHRIARVTDPDKRAGLGVALAKPQEIERIAFGQDCEVALQLALRKTRSLPGIGPGPDGCPHLPNGRVAQVSMRSLL